MPLQRRESLRAATQRKALAEGKAGLLGRKTPLRRTKLRAVSPKRAKQNREYATRRRVFLFANPVCQADCSAPSTQVHHKNGREGELLNDESEWMAICAKHHDWVHANPNEARQRGWLK